MKKENDLLEEALSIAENGYAAAYQFLLEEYEKKPEQYGPQTLYFLACLAGGDDLPEKALEWLRKAILDNGWWYRPEVLEDEDLASLKHNPAFISLKSISDSRYADAVSRTREVFTWERKQADKLFLAVHGNTQNGQIARDDWKPLLRDDTQWQLETIQSAEPDGYGTYRWSYNMVSYAPVANAIEKMQNKGYTKIVCGGFSAGCDMLLRAIVFTPARCDILILQSPWIPIMQDHSEEVVNAFTQKNIALRIFCGSDDEDCLPMAKHLFEVTTKEGIHVKIAIQEGNRHQFPKESFKLSDVD